MNTNKLHFKLNMLIAGILKLDFGNEFENYTYCFDENLSDAVPNMVKMYNNLKIYKDYQFKVFYIGDIIFSAKSLNTNTVELQIKYREAEEHAEFIDKIDREDCLKMFENLFDDILKNVDFPHQFPCFGDHNYEEYEKISAVSDKIFEELVKKNFCADDLEIFDVIDTIICRELININPTGLEYYQKYKNMLQKRELPEGWQVKDVLDPIG